MPKLIRTTPKYRRYKGSGQAIVTLDGKDIYLGPWRSKASLVEYDRLIGKWIQNGRTLRHEFNDTTVVEVIGAYLKFARGYYVKYGRPTREAEMFKDVARFIRPLYGRTRAVEFGPLALKAVRQKMIGAGHSRGYINKIDRKTGLHQTIYIPLAYVSLAGAIQPEILKLAVGGRDDDANGSKKEGKNPIKEHLAKGAGTHFACLPRGGWGIAKPCPPRGAEAQDIVARRSGGLLKTSKSLHPVLLRLG